MQWLEYNSVLTVEQSEGKQAALESIPSHTAQPQTLLQKEQLLYSHYDIFLSYICQNKV